MLLQIFVLLCIASITLSTRVERFENTDDRSNSDIMQKNDEADQLYVLRGIAKRDEYDMIEPTYELDEDKEVEKRRPVMRGVANFNEDDMIKRASERKRNDIWVRTPPPSPDRGGANY